MLVAPEDGPFFGWIIEPDRLRDLQAQGPTGPRVPDEAQFVGELEIRDRPFEEAPRFLVGRIGPCSPSQCPTSRRPSTTSWTATTRAPRPSPTSPGARPPDRYACDRRPSTPPWLPSAGRSLGRWAAPRTSWLAKSCQSSRKSSRAHSPPMQRTTCPGGATFHKGKLIERTQQDQEATGAINRPPDPQVLIIPRIRTQVPGTPTDLKPQARDVCGRQRITEIPSFGTLSQPSGIKVAGSWGPL